MFTQNFLTKIFSQVTLFVVFFTFLSFFIYDTNVQRISAGSQHNLSGYAWSETIGWVSFNCLSAGNCTTSDYGVTISPTTGILSGYAWSENIGWISFNETTGCPSGTCTPTMSLSTGALSGWAKAVAGGSSQSGGWDGWISLSGSSPAYGVTIPVLGGTTSGYAWGSTVVGWLQWSNVTYGGIPANNIPSAIIVSPISNPSITPGQSVSFSGSGTDIDGSIVSYQWKQTQDCTGTTYSSSVDTSRTYETEGTYYMSFLVQDDDGAWSTNCPSVTISVGVSTACDNNIDDDDDGFTDFGEDPDCSDLSDNDESATPSGYVCGNNTCERNLGENTFKCRKDCPLRIFEI